ncbi:lipase maturation factor 1 domain protein [Mycobacterium xenopi 4042]|uniref:Lipase maturation factor 1 domain protein n=1 Tax=Mycobacterium xenopi 4042 TaxID=1299334 RepID=X7ZC88_MYCXE|nr:lipase maturation factor 1 domain protein [Mycobacterium xenopi 4042]
MWAAMLMWLVLWVLYLSIVNVGQTWYSFGWESLLLETGFLAIFLGNARVGRRCWRCGWRGCCCSGWSSVPA